MHGAFVSLDALAGRTTNPRYYDLRAGLLLTVGRLGQAQAALENALRLNPNDATAYALQAIVAVTQNQNHKALKLAQKAEKLDHSSAVPRVALSYVYQALFDVEQARDNAEAAVKLNPRNALAWARLAELELSRGYLDKALAAANKAVEINPELGPTQTVLGFAHLTTMDIKAAETAFKNAIELDSAAPLPRLGMGLAKIRQGDLREGVEQIEIAASLDPDNSLIRSYLGKAYFEERRDALADTEYALAEQMDPGDPTPWFYQAIRAQLDNRPVEALHDLNRSIELNDYRSVYRSRLLLDQDLATRNTSLARIYDDLGFDRAALANGTESLSVDPANYSAHRYMSDTYAQLPRHEIARVSELLQAQLLQPLNVNPVQPSLAVKNLNVIAGAGPAKAAFNEYTPLFERNRPQLIASGTIGNHQTYGDEVVVSGLYNRLSYSLGQYHLETDGFRDNNDLEDDRYDVFAQYAITPQFNVQAEYRRRETEQGTLGLNFESLPPQNTERRDIDQDTFRLGMRFAPTPRSDILLSVIYGDRSEEIGDIKFPGSVVQATDQTGYDAQAQYLYRSEGFNLTAGGGAYDLKDKTTFPDNPDVPDSFRIDLDPKNRNGYLYANVNWPRPLIWTLGFEPRRARSHWA